MATLLSIQSGNLLDASTWALVDSTSFLETRTTEQALTTVQTNASAAFIPGTITVAGVAVQVGTRLAAPTGTMTIRLYNNTAAAVVKDVVINVTDLPSTNGTLNGCIVGWTYFKFDTSVTLIAGNQYSIRAFSSVNSQVTLYRNAVTGNWNRALVTTTTQAPVAADVLITAGAYTSVGVNSSVTVTMNSTSLATQYGNCYVGSNGTLNYGVAPSTNYGLRLAGDLWIGRGGTFTIGTAANPIPATSTAILEINCTTPLQYQIIQFGTLETKYETTVLHRALLNADIAVGATSMTTDVSTGWKQNDVIVIPSTTRTTTQFERVTLSANASGTSLSHNATTYAHDGNAAIYIQADLANLTRNIKIRSVSSTNRTRFRPGLLGVTNLFDVEFFEMGSNTHASGTAQYTGTLNVQQCTFWQIASPGTTILFANINITTYDVSNNVFYNYSEFTSTINNNNLIIGFTGFAAISQAAIGNNNVISSCSQAGYSGTMYGSTTGNRFYATAGNGAWYATSNSLGHTISNTVFFNNSQAIRYIPSTATTASDRTVFDKFENCYFYGNVTNIDIIASGNVTNMRRLWFNNCFFWGGKTGLLTAIGYAPFAGDYTHFSNCTFGRMPIGTDSFFTTSCLRGGHYGSTLTNCLFYGTQYSFVSQNFFSTVHGFNGLISLKHNGTINEYRLAQSNGLIQNDNVITYNGNPSIRITPAVLTNKTFSSPVRVAIKSGETCNVSVAIRRSVPADGSIYNGVAPRLMYAFNPLAGNLTETVGASYTNNNLISYTQTLVTGWTQSQCFATQNATIAPNGELDGDKIIPFGTTSEHPLYPNIGSPALGNTETYSVYAKAGGYNYLGLRVQISGVWSVSFFNLATGVISTSSPSFISTDITSVGNGWYRCSITYANRSVAGFQIIPAPSELVTFTGNSVDGIFVWGAKLEVGTLTDYVPDGTWETLSYTTPPVNNDSVLEFYVDCDGVTGWINIDNFKTTTSNDTKSMNYWSTVGVYAEPDWRKPGGTVTFVN